MNLLKQLIVRWQKIPMRTHEYIFIILSLLIICNIGVWFFGFIVSRDNPLLLGLLTIAYGLGLRHAVDADHIAAIDNITRKFMVDGKRPISIGLYFSLGHSTIVILLSLVIATASSFVEHFLSSYQSIGFVIGTSISTLFLFLIASLNLITFFTILQNYRQPTSKQSSEMKLIGPLSKFFSPLFQTVNKPWHMYFVGLLFGLGFDTASEVGLLSISAINGLTNASVLVIILIPLAFTAGMTLIDTADGMLMLVVYGWAYIKPERKLSYNLIITLLSVIVAFVIGSIQIFSLFSLPIEIGRASCRERV